MTLADVRAFLEDILDERHFAPPTVKANAKDCIAALDGLEDRMTAYIVEHGNRASLWAMALRAEEVES